MPDALKDVRDIFAKAEVQLAQDDVWSVQGTPVVKHKALERLAGTLKIRFAKPDILRHERDEAVLLVTGTLGDESEWSIGEACVNVNYRVSPKMAAYPYAMAEKRAKDRVILKLAKLPGVYSEEEADELKERKDQANGENLAKEPVDRIPPAASHATKFTPSEKVWGAFRIALSRASSTDQIAAYVKKFKQKYALTEAEEKDATLFGMDAIAALKKRAPAEKREPINDAIPW
jgi:hypothetical protein